MNMKKALLTLCVCSVAALAEHDDVKRINASTEVFKEIMAAPDKGVPQDILEKAECVVIVPGLKRAGFIVGGQYGKGVMTCKTAARGWSGPSMIRVEGGSFGAQIGAGETDLLLVVMNKRGAKKLMKSEFTLGGDAAAMGGPVGRQASADTDAYMHAEILSYSRARGLFAGVTLKGSTLREDHDDNVAVYGKDVTHEQILMGKVAVPASAKELLATLRPYVKSGKASD